MHTIQTTAVISEDRKLVLQLPPDVAPGEYRLRVLIDEPGQVLDEIRQDEQTPTRWEGNVLVYAGEVVGPIENAIADSREERMRHLLAGFQPTDHGQLTTDQ
jgi:hypothetical protein